MAIYGVDAYGSELYGAFGLPVSDPWNIFDFCEPNDATMLSFYTYAEVSLDRGSSPVSPYNTYNGSNDFCMFSDDEDNSGFTVDIAVPTAFSIQFTILPTALPEDFSSLATERVFFGVYNRHGKMMGLLLSENGGLAFAQDGSGTGFSHIVDSADLFSEGVQYYTFRVTVDTESNNTNIYVTPTSQLSTIGHQLRYTTHPLDSLATQNDGVAVEVYGSAANPTTVCLDCIRLADDEIIPNFRPIADAGPNQTSSLYKYAAFDGRASYDPEGEEIRYWWTITVAPEDSEMWVDGSGLTQSDPTDYTNVVHGPSGSAAGTFDDVVQGDLFFVEDTSSTVKYVAEDGSYVVTMDHVFPDDTSALSWNNLKQSAWDGQWMEASMINVEDYTDTEPALPDLDDIYLIGNTPSGPNWTAGDAGKIATWNGSSWDIVDPTVGQIVYSIAAFLSYRLIDTGPYEWVEDDPVPWELGKWTGRTEKIGTMLPDTPGLFSAELVVNDGTSMVLPPKSASIDGSLTSLPSEAICNVSPTGAPLGIVPDLSFIWNYLSNFWTLAEGKELFNTVWSAAAQILSGDMLELWQHDYAKSIFDIQRLFQRRWRGYDFFFEEPNYDDTLYEASIDVTVDTSGYSDSPGLNDYSYDLGTTPPAGTQSGHMLVLNGQCYEITRIAGNRLITKDILPETTNAILYLTSASGDFQLGETVTGVTSSATGTVLEIGWNFLVLDDPSSTDFTVSETITGGTSGVNAEVTGYSPATTQRPRYWQIRPQVVSKQTDFTEEAVDMADTAVFDIFDIDENDHLRVGCFIYGARGYTLCFDDAPLVTYQADPDRYEIRFFGVIHRNYIPVDDSVRMLSSLQEVVDVDNVEGAPDILIGNNDFIVETITAVDDRSVQVVNLLESYFDRRDYGFDGETAAGSATQYFDVPSGGLLTSLGDVGADLSNHILWIDGGSRYRLLQVVSDTRVELVDAALAPSLSGLHWRILNAGDPPDRSWAETTYVDNTDAIENNFGTRVAFKQDAWLSQTEDLDYLSAVQGLWYAFWNGPTVNNVQTACQVLMGLPFAEKRGTITDIRTPFSSEFNRVLVQDDGDEIVVRSYKFSVELDVAINPETGVTYEVGDTIEQFASVCTGVVVEDYVENPTWFEAIVGSGDMNEVQKYHTFGVTINSAAFNYTNIVHMISYLVDVTGESTSKVRPHYTFPIAVVSSTLVDDIDVQDAMLFGPAWPPETAPSSGTYYKYPDNASWRDKLEDTTTGWATAPALPPANRWETAPTYDSTTRWPNDRASNVPPRFVEEHGGLHLEDIPGSVADEWTGSWPQNPAGYLPYDPEPPDVPTKGDHLHSPAEGTFLYGSTDESGRFIHKYGPDTINQLSNPDFDSGYTNWSIVNYGGSILPGGSVIEATYEGRTNVLHYTTADGPSMGLAQTIYGATAGHQVFADCEVKVVAGQFHFQLYDGGPSLLAEWRVSAPSGGFLKIPLHVWRATSNVVSVRLLSGPAGGEFYVDTVGVYTLQPPVTQWGYGRMYLGRTGGYTVGGSPDEDMEFTIYGTYP